MDVCQLWMYASYLVWGSSGDVLGWAMGERIMTCTAVEIFPLLLPPPALFQTPDLPQSAHMKGSRRVEEGSTHMQPDPITFPFCCFYIPWFLPAKKQVQDMSLVGNEEEKVIKVPLPQGNLCNCPFTQECSSFSVVASASAGGTIGLPSVQQISLLGIIV